MENCFCRMFCTITGPQIFEPNTAQHKKDKGVQRCPPVGGYVTYLLAFHRFQFALKKQCVVVLLSHLSVEFTSVCLSERVCVCARWSKAKCHCLERTSLHKAAYFYTTYPHLITLTHIFSHTHQVTRQKEEDSVSIFPSSFDHNEQWHNYELANASVNWSKQSAIVPHSFLIVSLQCFCQDCFSPEIQYRIPHH